MATSGHPRKFMGTVAIRGISSYEQKLRKSQLPKDDPGYAPLYMGSYNSLGSRQEVGQDEETLPEGWKENATFKCDVCP